MYSDAIQQDKQNVMSLVCFPWLSTSLKGLRWLQRKRLLPFFPSSFPLYILVVFHVFSHPAFTLQATRVMCCSFVTVCMLSCLDRLFLRPQLWEQWKATCFYHFSSVFPDVNSFWGGKLARKHYLCSTQDINIHLYVILNILYYNIFY